MEYSYIMSDIYKPIAELIVLFAIQETMITVTDNNLRMLKVLKSPNIITEVCHLSPYKY
jgi:hypothetical protein